MAINNCMGWITRLPIMAREYAVHNTGGSAHRMSQCVVELARMRREVEQVRGDRWKEFTNQHGDSGLVLFLWAAR